MSSYRDLADSTKAFIRSVPPGKRYTLAAMTILGLGAIAALMFWAFRPQYRLLYSDLSLKDSGDIVSALEDEKVPYRLEEEGKRILVPAEKLYNVRLKLASLELPHDRTTGWEIFDQTNLGLTDFVQKLNYHRGLEGELGRTILQLEHVEAVRVHLSIPQESLFRENQKQPMASVTLRLTRGHKLTPAQVEGVTYMVASAVEGLEPENVTVLDSKGLILSEKTETNPVMRLSASQLEIQRQIEDDLVQKGERLLDMQFGPGRSAIQLTAEMDFQQREVTREIYDSENPAVRSEEVTSSSSQLSDTTSSRNESTVTNYELNLTRERQVNPVGVIKRLSAAVMVDGEYPLVENPGTGEEERTFRPLAEDRLAEVTSTMRSALGFNADRGDELTVVSVPFQEVSLLEHKEVITRDIWQRSLSLAQKIIPLLAILLLLLTVRNFLKRAQEVTVEEKLPELPQLGPGVEPAALPAPTPPAPPRETKVSDEAQKAKELNERMIKYVRDNPEMTARLIRAWIVEKTE